MFGELPRSRSEAKQLSSKYYFTGIECANGHKDKRKTTNGHCMECDRMRQRKRMKEDPEYREIHRKSCRKRMRRLLSDPETRRRIRARDKELRQTSEHRKLRKKLADSIRNSREEVKVRNREHSRKPERRAKANEICSRRRAMKYCATPNWLDVQMKASISGIYLLAKLKTEVSGRSHHVDHIVPLKNDFVCGLHVPWNLQIITAKENVVKYNTFRV